MQAPQAKLKAIQRLLSGFPASQAVDQAELLRRYLEVAEDFHADDVLTSVDLYLKSQMPGFDGRYAPTPPMLAAGCRRAADIRARKAYLDGLTRPDLPAPAVERTPGAQQRVRALMGQAVASLSKSEPTDDAAAELAKRQAKQKLAKHDAFFADDFVATDGGVGRISKSLARIIGYEVGDEDGDREVA